MCIVSYMPNHQNKKVKYGKLPLKEVETSPWDVLCINLIRPYKITNNNNINNYIIYYC